MPPNPAGPGPRVIASVTRKQTTWALFICLTSASSIILGLAIATSQRTTLPRPQHCEGHHHHHHHSDPVLWQLLSQTLLRIFLIFCLLVRSVRDKGGAQGPATWQVASYPVFYVAISAAFAAEVLVPVLYATVCGSAGRLAGLLLGWVAALTTAGAVAQFATAVEKEAVVTEE